MLRIALLLSVLALPAWAQGWSAVLQPSPVPLNANASFNGDILTDDTEFLTPEGIQETIDTPMISAEDMAAIHDVEPAAGVSETEVSPTEPAVRLL